VDDNDPIREGLDAMIGLVFWISAILGALAVVALVSWW
jgi:hypothetical protein